MARKQVETFEKLIVRLREADTEWRDASAALALAKDCYYSDASADPFMLEARFAGTPDWATAVRDVDPCDAVARRDAFARHRLERAEREEAFYRERVKTIAKLLARAE